MATKEEAIKVSLTLHKGVFPTGMGHHLQANAAGVP